MNPFDWDAFQSLQRNLHPNQQNDLNNHMERTNHEWDPYCDYTRHVVDEAPSSMGENVGLKGLGPPSQNFYNKDSEEEDGEPLAMDEEDPELARKRKELREIEERILLKKASIALKSAEPFMKKTTSPDFNCNEQSAACEGAALKDRVMALLQPRHPASFLSKVRSPKERMKSSSLRDDHPLKLRVKALMKHRCSHPCVFPASREVRDVSPLPPNTNVTPPAKEDGGISKGFQRFLSILNEGGPDVSPPPPNTNVTSPAKDAGSMNKTNSSNGFQRFLSVLNEGGPDISPPPLSPNATSPAKDAGSMNKTNNNKGFQRFLSILNEGVDMDFLRKVVNDDAEDPPLGEEPRDVQPPATESKSDPPFRSESQQSNSGASLPGSSRTNSGERKTDPPSRKEPIHERLYLPGDDEKSDRRDRCRSKSPAAAKNKKKKEDKNPKVDEQQEQLQNILKTLGLSLEVEEMSKLSNRTQERLYGKKHEDRRADGRGEQESQQSSPRRHYSVSSSSSRSTKSRSLSPRPSRRRRSQDSKRRSERSRSRDGSRDGLTGDNQGSKEAQRSTDKGGKDSKEISTHQIPTYQNPCSRKRKYPQPAPAGFSAFADYSLSQDSQYSASPSDTYSAATDSYWTDTQGAVPPSLKPSSCPYPQNPYSPCPRSVKPFLEDINAFGNPDLSKSEGQTGNISGPRCLQVIHNAQPTRTCQMSKRRPRKDKPILQRNLSFLKAEKNFLANASPLKAPQLETHPLDNNEVHSKVKQSEEKKLQPTEEEIKLNLRKKLELFNQMMKQKTPQPTYHQPPHTD